jgi:hypothetical protein
MNKKIKKALLIDLRRHCHTEIEKQCFIGILWNVMNDIFNPVNEGIDAWRYIWNNTYDNTND